jgi:uncharacterized protein YjbI with pentapeptide repeats
MRTRLRVGRWRLWKKWRKEKPIIAKSVLYFLIITAIITGMVAISIWADWFPEWTGVSAYESQTTERTGSSATTQTTIVRGKTLWDLMELLIVPVVLASIAIWFNKRMREAEQKATEERLREEALQTYFDRMSELSLDHNLYKADKNSDVRFIARARTLNIFQRLDGHRKGMVLSFLYSLDLIRCKMGDNWQIKTYPTIGLTGADLSGISVPGGALTAATLKNVYLENVHLPGANLHDVDLSEAVLAVSWLVDADLRNAKLCGANLKIAILVGVSFDGADLSGANLKNAVVTPEQLGKAKSLEGCVMPSGTLYDSQKPLDEQCELFREKEAA